MTSRRSNSQRRKPKQARARATVEAILEAAAQILERDGTAGYNTNAIAERAGVSVGTLYQYFPDKQAILMATAAREAAQGAPSLAERSNALLRALVSFLDSLGVGPAANLATTLPVSARPGRRHRRGSIVIRLQWAQPAWPLQPLLTPALLRGRPRHR
jgi:AcrR family transcriptional regulator